MPVQLEIQLLGHFRLRYKGVPLTAVDRPRQQALLAYLLLHRDAPRSRQQLAFEFWSDSTEKQARSNVRNIYHRLRRVFPEIETFIQADTHRLQWQPTAPFSLDVMAFEQALAEADQPDMRQAALEQALALYQGPLLPSCYDDWIIPHRERLQQQAGQALLKAQYKKTDGVQDQQLCSDMPED